MNVIISLIQVIVGGVIAGFTIWWLIEIKLWWDNRHLMRLVSMLDRISPRRDDLGGLSCLELIIDEYIELVNRYCTNDLRRDSRLGAAKATQDYFRSVRNLRIFKEQS